MQPEWEEIHRRYVKEYVVNHPLDKREDAERLSGMERLRQKTAQSEVGMDTRENMVGRAGLLTVFMNGDESAGKVV
jgi:hypothetical protein